jgi:cell shape-determining protein MreD
MWRKTLVIIFLFYFFTLLQNSFFPHFNLFGAIPNLVFILFFLLVFFSSSTENIIGNKKESRHPLRRMSKNYQVIFLAITAGIFLDFFSYTYLGPSIAIFIIIGFLLKNIQSLLKNKEDSCPFIYFLPLFTFFLLVYDLLSDLYLKFLDSNKIAIVHPLGLVKGASSIIYNLIIASALFYIYKIFLASKQKNF